MKQLLVFLLLQVIGISVSAKSTDIDEADAWFEYAFGAGGDDNIIDSAPPELYDPAGWTYVNTINPDAPYHKAKGGIIVTGEPGEVRAMQTFSWSSESVGRYADVANLYAREFPGVKVYCMPVPLASEFYTPTAAAPAPSQSQYAAIRKMFSYLDPDVTGVNLVPSLARHVAEPIYSRTDHHWAPLGAYYAAGQLAAAAGVPFMDLSEYDRHEVPDYVGTMYKFSRDASVKASPETFVYYTPRDVEYTTTYITYRTSGLRVTSESDPAEGDFFLPFKGVSTYCTFMGGDTKITKVHTSTANGRRVLLLKDSFGNAVAGYLFGSFEEVHVADCRYFTKNMKQYVADNGITDIVFVNNLGHATMERTCASYRRYLNQ